MTDGLSKQAATGTAGLDDVRGGGFERRRLFLLEGNPGTGKTTVSMQFLLAGAQARERVLYITLAETEEELRARVGQRTTASSR